MADQICTACHSTSKDRRNPTAAYLGIILVGPITMIALWAGIESGKAAGVWVAVLLWALLPGLAVAIWRNWRPVCPACYQRGLIPLASPRGQALQASLASVAPAPAPAEAPAQPAKPAPRPAPDFEAWRAAQQPTR